MTPHEFVGRLDRPCEVCWRPDRDQIHVWPEPRPVAQSAEAADSSPAQCEFESHQADMGEVLIRVTDGDSEVEVRVTYDPDEVDEMIGDGHVVAVARTQNARRALNKAHRMMDSGVDR